MRQMRGGINTGRCEGETDRENKNAGFSPLLINKGTQDKAGRADKEKER